MSYIYRLRYLTEKGFLVLLLVVSILNSLTPSVGRLASRNSGSCSIFAPRDTGLSGFDLCVTTSVSQPKASRFQKDFWRRPDPLL